MAAGLDYSASDVSEATFRDVFLPPFKAGVEVRTIPYLSRMYLSAAVVGWLV